MFLLVLQQLSTLRLCQCLPAADWAEMQINHSIINTLMLLQTTLTSMSLLKTHLSVTQEAQFISVIRDSWDSTISLKVMKDFIKSQKPIRTVNWLNNWGAGCFFQFWRSAILLLNKICFVKCSAVDFNAFSLEKYVTFSH